MWSNFELFFDAKFRPFVGTGSHIHTHARCLFSSSGRFPREITLVLSWGHFILLGYSGFTDFFICGPSGSWYSFRKYRSCSRLCSSLGGICMLGAFYQNTQSPRGQEREAEWSRLWKRESHSPPAPQHPGKGKLCATCSVDRNEANPPWGEPEAEIHVNGRPPCTARLPAAEELRNGASSSSPLQREPWAGGA